VFKKRGEARLANDDNEYAKVQRLSLIGKSHRTFVANSRRGDGESGAYVNDAPHDGVDSFSQRLPLNTP
jgi:hypothetical protein